MGEKGLPAMELSLESSLPREAEEALAPRQREVGSGTSGEASDLSSWLWGGWKHMKQTRFPIRDLWCRTQQCGVGACGRLSALISDNREQLFASYRNCSGTAGLVWILWWLPRIWWASVSTGTAGTPPRPARLCCWSCEHICKCCRAGTEGGL